MWWTPPQILEGLHSASLELLERWNNVVRGRPLSVQLQRCHFVCSARWMSPFHPFFFLALAPRQIKPTLPEAKQRTSIQFLLGDATEIDWSDATMWFANSTCFDEELMRKLAVVSGGCLAHGCGRCGPPCPLPSHTLSHVRSRHPLPHTRFPVPLSQASCGDLRDYLYKAPALGQVDRAGARGTGMG